MLQNQQFVQSLIELRSHYQSLQDEYERSITHATQQLNHINALLVDQLVGDQQQFVESLLQLREHYQALHQQHQQKVQSAKEQQNHVNALLADQAVLRHTEQQSISIQAATLEQKHLNQASNKVIDDDSEGAQRQEPEAVEEPELPDTSQQELPKDVIQGEQDRVIAERSEEAHRQDLEVVKEQEQLQVSEPQILTDSNQAEQQPEPEPPIESPAVENSLERSLLDKLANSPSSRHAAPLKTPLLPQYQHLTKSEAIENLLHEHSGTVLHVNFIIRALYGELTADDIAAEKPRMNDSLKKGVAKGLWDKMPDSLGFYTADFELVEKEVEPKKAEGNKRQGRKPNSKVTEGMLPRYLNLTFTEAVESVLRDRSGEIITTDIMARSLYGELDGQELTEAKTKVGKIMWSGANQGRWQNVPGQKGAYTLSLQGE